MVRWCIRRTRLTLVCEVIRYRLVQVRQNLKKKKKIFRVGGPQSPISISSSFILFFVLLPFFLNTKSTLKKKKSQNYLHKNTTAHRFMDPLLCTLPAEPLLPHDPKTPRNFYSMQNSMHGCCPSHHESKLSSEFSETRPFDRTGSLPDSTKWFIDSKRSPAVTRDSAVRFAEVAGEACQGSVAQDYASAGTAACCAAGPGDRHLSTQR